MMLLAGGNWTVVALAASDSTVVTINDYWLTFIVSVILPALTALVTKRFAPSEWRAAVLLFLSTVTGFATSLYATGGELVLSAAVTGVAVSFVTAYAAHRGLLQPFKVTGDDGIVARATPRLGIGPGDPWLPPAGGARPRSWPARSTHRR